MTNRREVLQMSMAVTLASLDAATAWAAPSGGTGRDAPAAPLYTALYDARFAASRVFGERMAAQGVTTAALADGDMTALWYNNLHFRWREGPVAIAGLTTRGPLFCLEQLAWDHGMRVVFRAQHASARDGSILHEIEGAGVLMDVARHVAAEDGWAAGLSDAIGHYSHTGGAKTRVQVHTARPAVQVPEDEMLFSWVIAPVARS
ncbi:MAG TPA: hypothetical protein VNR18_12020 [Hyphomicrobiales bacterium]|nr:hypothetical protein [Hyphomicrobiales bacterium]